MELRTVLILFVVCSGVVIISGEVGATSRSVARKHLSPAVYTVAKNRRSSPVNPPSAPVNLPSPLPAQLIAPIPVPAPPNVVAPPVEVSPPPVVDQSQVAAQRLVDLHTNFINTLHVGAFGVPATPPQLGLELAQTAVFGCAQFALNFMTTNDFSVLSLRASDKDYVTVLYKALLNRAPDSGGYKAWMDALAAGSSRQVVADQILQSYEFDQDCRLNYGYTRAGAYSSATNTILTPSAKSIAHANYVVQLYDGYILRSPDSSELISWLTVADGFSCAQLSQNFKKLNFAAIAKMSDGEFVFANYKGLLGRAPDDGGYNGWLKILGSGSTRQAVDLGFIQSAEFNQDCITNYGYSDGAGAL